MARHILDGHMKPFEIPAVATDSLKEITSTIKGVSNNFEFLSNDYNLAGVYTFTNKSDQYMIVNSLFDAKMDVEVLASAFNMSKAEFMGNRVMIDSFGSLDLDRLKELFADDPTFILPTEEELKALDEIPAVIVDKDWFMIFDNYFNFTEQYNGEGLYWNYWYHVWKTFSVSPFANNALFIPGKPAVTGVDVSPKIVTAKVGQDVQFKAKVTTDNFASQAVKWSTNSAQAVVDASGKVTLLKGATSTITVTATSVFDDSKNGIATINVES